MNVDKDRKDAGYNHIIYAFLLTFLFVVCFAGYAIAEPTDQSLQASEAKVLESQHAAGDATDSASALVSERAKSDKRTDTPSENQPKKKASAESDYKLRADSKSDGQLHLDSYQDPGKAKEESSPIIRVLQTIFDFIKYVFYLAVVLAVGFLAIYGVKMFTTKYNTLTGGGNDLLNILEVKYLAPGKAVCLVEIADKVLVLGLAGNNINRLSEFVEIEQVEALKQAAARKPEALQPFQAALEKVSKRFTAAPANKSRKPVRKRREAAPQEEAHWSEELHSTGDNIRKLLEDIKEQDTKKRGSRQSPKRDRGEERK